MNQRRHSASTAIVNLPLLLRIVGWLLIIECLFMAAPLLVCLAYGESDWEAFALSAAVTAVSGLGLTTLVKPRSSSMGKREGFMLTALVWAIFSLFGMLPFVLSAERLSVSDAYFEAMSSFTTTGASTLHSVEILSHGLLFWRSLMQWIGGLGIILFTLAVIPMLNQNGGMQMFNAEVTGITHEKIRPRVGQTAKGLWMVYILLTSLLCVLLYLGPMDLFDSVCHAFSIMSTGGISTRDESIMAWNTPYVEIIVTLFMFLGGVNFALIFQAGCGEVRRVWSNQILRIYVTVILVTSVALIIFIGVTGRFESMTELFLDPFFQVVSLITSTGYTLDAMVAWGPAVLLVMFVLMFFGGCAGSTSGGAKIDRCLVLVQHCRNEIQRCIHPNNILSVSANGRVVPRDIVSKSVAFLCLYVIIIIISTIIITILGAPMSHAAMTSFSAISNAGIVTPEMGINTAFLDLPDTAKWILSLVMLTGRLEIFTVLLIFSPDFWQR